MKRRIKRLTNREMRKWADTIVSQKIDRAMKASGMDKIDRKFGMLDPAIFGKDFTEKDLLAMDKKERIAKFIKAIFYKDINAVKALSGGVAADGGFQVPEEFAAEVNRVIEDFGLVRKLSRLIPMSTDRLHIPRLASSVGVTFPGENTAGSETQPVWEEVLLEPETAVGLTVMSNELMADANISIVDLLTELFAEALAGEEDFQGFAGVGTPFTGILTAADVNEKVLASGKTDPADADADDYRDVIALVKPWSLQGAAWFLHRTVWAEVQKKKDSNGAFIASALNPIQNPVAGTPQSQSFNNLIVGTLWGYPVYLSDKLPTAGVSVDTEFAIFGNLRHLYFGNRAEITMAISDSASVGANSTFERNQQAIRVTERFATVVGLPAALARIKTASS